MQHYTRFLLAAALLVLGLSRGQAQSCPDSVAVADSLTLAADSVALAADTLMAQLASAQPAPVLSLPDTVVAGHLLMAGDQVVGRVDGKPLTLYDLPYSPKRRMENWRRLAYNTTAFVGAGVVTLFVLECLPEGATAWDKSEIKHTSFWHRYGNHVADGPVWDKDNFVFNYILHPYGGAVYYMSARSNGFNILGSFLYASFVSNVLWEYGIEAFMEIPSIQDMFVTPVCGSLIGEGFYRVKRSIVANDYCLWGSKACGKIVAWLVDPINEFVSLFAGNPWKYKKAKPGHIQSLECVPSVNLFGHHPQVGFSAVITL